MNMISPMIEVIGASTGSAVSGGSAPRRAGALGDDLAGLVDVGAPVELHRDHGDADAGGGAHAAHAGARR
jgi:hypothetical protein